MNGITVRPMVAADLPELWAIFQEIIEAGDTYALDATTTAGDFQRYFCDRGGEQWVAERDGRVVGGYTLRANQPGRGSGVGTASYGVARAARGGSVGRRLGEHSLERAQAMGFAAMQFNLVVSTNVAAVRLWQSLGFRVLTRLPRAFQHARLGAVDALVMFRELRDNEVREDDGREDEALCGRAHAAVLRGFVDHGRAPTVLELSATLDVSPVQVEAALRRLHQGHGLVLHPPSAAAAAGSPEGSPKGSPAGSPDRPPGGSVAVWIAHPFSASPTATWVASQRGRGWWAPCMWCALGIAVLVKEDVTIHTRLGGESSEAQVVVRDGRLLTDERVVHFGLPARHAWDNVVHWCATVLPFARAEDVAPWSARHAIPRGDVVPLTQVLALAREWYGGHLREDWRKWSLDDARAIFERVGLRGEIWSVPTGEARF
jgi:ribosomal protein S18 acetylase RimI-like enzyme